MKKIINPNLLLLLAVLCLLTAQNNWASVQNEWEARSTQGEMIVPDLFYAEDFQNEQVAPIALEDGQYLIENLIYPTLGNPNFFHRHDTEDELPVIVRIKNEDLQNFPESVQQSATTANEYDTTLGDDVLWANSPNDEIRVILANTKNRIHLMANEITTIETLAKGQGIYLIRPSRIFKHDQANLPSPFNLKQTYRLLFNAGDLSNIPAGLYDLRIEIIRNGELRKREYQYNAVKIFNELPENNLDVINIADSQISTHFASFTKISGQSNAVKEMREFVNHVRYNQKKNYANIPFILSSGDLLNGGGVGLLDINQIFFNYQDETNAAFQNLKDLPYPVILAPGNHDGHVSLGWHLGEEGKTKLGQALQEINPQQSPVFQQLIKTLKLKNFPGKDLDIFEGNYLRKLGSPLVKDSYIQVPKEDRNFILYDGLNHWRKLFGPTYFSFRWGRHYFISLNSFDLRQHRRAGIGQYVVNHGGNISPLQMDWLRREIQMAEELGLNVTLLSHHDPRGGKENDWFGHYFYQRKFKGIWNSMWNFIRFRPPFRAKDCKEKKGKCFEGGLHEWMLPDPMFDCPGLPYNKNEKSCVLKQHYAAEDLIFSGPDILKEITKSPIVKNVIMGHLHGLRMDISHQGQRLVPNKSPNQKHKIDIINDEHSELIDALNDKLNADEYQIAGHDLLFAKMASISSLAQDRISLRKPIYGFSVLSFGNRGGPVNQNDIVLKEVNFFQNMKDNMFSKYTSFSFDRSRGIMTKTVYPLKPQDGQWAENFSILSESGNKTLEFEATDIQRPSIEIE